MNAKIKKLLLWGSVLLLTTGCAPKIGKLYVMDENKSALTAEVSIIRNYNFEGSGIRFYPTVENKKIAGLYTKDYVHFYLKEGNYKFGLMVPDVIFGRWIDENSIEKKIKAEQKYFFLLSPTFISSMEIEEIEQKEAEERMASSRLIKTGTLSNEVGVVGDIIKPLSDLMGLDENEETIE